MLKRMILGFCLVEEEEEFDEREESASRIVFVPSSQIVVLAEVKDSPFLCITMPMAEIMVSTT